MVLFLQKLTHWLIRLPRMGNLYSFVLKSKAGVKLIPDGVKRATNEPHLDGGNNHS